MIHPRQHPADTQVTVVATVLNEGPAVNRLLDSLLAGDRLPDAVVIIDGGSSDDTLQRVSSYDHARIPIHVRTLPGCGIAAGRNAAIAAASTPWVAVTDAGVELSRGWLRELMAGVEAEPPDQQPEAVAGFFVPDATTLFAFALAAVTLPDLTEIDPRAFLPSSRSFACRRDVWAEVGGYPEWLDYGEDLVFDLRLKLLGARFAWAPSALVSFRPRSDLAAFWRQYFRYARGDGKALLWTTRHAIRYATYIGSMLVIGAAWRRVVPRYPVLGLLLAASVAYHRRPVRRLFRRTAPRHARLLALPLIPLLRLTGDLAKMFGYPCGLVWRLRHHPPAWRRVGGA